MKTFFTTLFLFLGFYAGAQNKLSEKPVLPAHPRLLLLKGEEEKIKKTLQSNPLLEQLQLGILAKCDQFLDVAPVERIKIGRRLLDKSRTCLQRVFYLSYAWRMTRQQKYLKRAEKEMLAAAAFEDWNSDHFLDVAEMTMALAIGYDWLYQDLSEQSRKLIKTAIITKGLEPSMLSGTNMFWIKAAHNWNQVCNAGLSFGALAVYEDQPDLARNIINRAINTIELPMKIYEPDGAYPEGYGYWNYGTTFNVMLIDAFQKAFGNDFGLSEKPGFLKTAEFMLHMTGPTTQPFNYFDSGTKGESNPAMFWFAAKLKNPSLLFNELGYLSKPGKQLTEDRLLPTMFIWSMGLHLNRIPVPKETMWVGKGINPVVMMRSSWTDPDALYIGMKGGSPAINHGHMDAGSFVMEAGGIRWASDFGMQSYESLESKGIDLWNMKQTSQRWQVLRYNNLYHNTLSFNNAFQHVEGNAPIISYSNQPSFKNAVIDISSVYQAQVTKAIRGIAMVNNDYVIVRDELQSNTTESTVRWAILTSANVKIINPREAELSKNGKKLILRIQEPLKVQLKTWSTAPTTAYDAPNPGTLMLGFETALPAKSSTVLNVLLIPQGRKNKVMPQTKPSFFSSPVKTQEQ
ncbi:heparinase II/III family protein [Pedobacter heparinus]|uniref:heparinase II/III domain-containing protein n=1 Tax=Pedobacter heparinus TaxID=984 RepID=UPI0029303D2B|nr:heparinase II/III family protein [Pedobacter heparinus]